jgi:hypothetical protein
MFRHYKHKDIPFNIYRDEERAISSSDIEVVSSINWDPIEEFESIDGIPPAHREKVRQTGSSMYYTGPSEAFDWLSKGSLRHKADIKSDGTVGLSAVDSTKSSIEGFQEIAAVVHNQAMHGHIRILLDHKSSRYTGYDLIIISDQLDE